MNVRNVSSLIRDDITTIGVKFHDHESKVYTNSKIDPDFAVNYKWAIVDSRTGQIVQRYMRKPYRDVYDKFPQKKKRGGVKRITR